VSNVKYSTEIFDGAEKFKYKDDMYILFESNDISDSE